MLSFFRELPDFFNIDERTGRVIVPDDSELIKKIVKMDIESDENGMVYYGELLFKLMRSRYGSQRVLNKLIA